MDRFQELSVAVISVLQYRCFPTIQQQHHLRVLYHLDQALRYAKLLYKEALPLRLAALVIDVDDTPSHSAVSMLLQRFGFEAEVEAVIKLIEHKPPLLEEVLLAEELSFESMVVTITRFGEPNSITCIATDAAGVWKEVDRRVALLAGNATTKSGYSSLDYFYEWTLPFARRLQESENWYIFNYAHRQAEQLTTWILNWYHRVLAVTRLRALSVSVDSRDSCWLFLPTQQIWDGVGPLNIFCGSFEYLPTVVIGAAVRVDDWVFCTERVVDSTEWLLTGFHGTGHYYFASFSIGSSKPADTFGVLLDYIFNRLWQILRFRAGPITLPVRLLPIDDTQQKLWATSGGVPDLPHSLD